MNVNGRDGRPVVYADRPANSDDVMIRIDFAGYLAGWAEVRLTPEDLELIKRGEVLRVCAERRPAEDARNQT
jgi:hypothetical protein